MTLGKVQTLKVLVNFILTFGLIGAIYVGDTWVFTHAFISQDIPHKYGELGVWIWVGAYLGSFAGMTFFIPKLMESKVEPSVNRWLGRKLLP